MTNNNGIPFEVKKPFETVQELKNEVPSYEEFMKTYESDENLNYDDLSYSDISDKGKGYGPCYRNCGWNNPNCSYQAWMYLKVPCPASDCPDGGRGRVYEWVHATDYGDIQISDCANMRCYDCRTVHHMKDWLFKCPKHVAKHQGDRKYWSVDYDSFNIALNAVFKAEGNPEVMKKLRLHLIEHPEEWK